jgi:hypothetical protein
LTGYDNVLILLRNQKRTAKSTAHQDAGAARSRSLNSKQRALEQRRSKRGEYQAMGV